MHWRRILGEIYEWLQVWGVKTPKGFGHRRLRNGRMDMFQNG
jgi:hypothetical protein